MQSIYNLSALWTFHQSHDHTLKIFHQKDSPLIGGVKEGLGEDPSYNVYCLILKAQSFHCFSPDTLWPWAMFSWQACAICIVLYISYVKAEPASKKFPFQDLYQDHKNARQTVEQTQTIYNDSFAGHVWSSIVVKWNPRWLSPAETTSQLGFSFTFLRVWACCSWICVPVPSRHGLLVSLSKLEKQIQNGSSIQAARCNQSRVQRWRSDRMHYSH